MIELRPSEMGVFGEEQQQVVPEDVEGGPVPVGGGAHPAAPHQHGACSQGLEELSHIHRWGEQMEEMPEAEHLCLALNTSHSRGGGGGDYLLHSTLFSLIPVNQIQLSPRGGKQQPTFSKMTASLLSSGSVFRKLLGGI